MKEITDICVYGIGGIGSAIGGLLCSKVNRNKTRVSFIARGQHLEAINRDGLKLRLPDCNEITCRPDYTNTRISQVPRPQLIFVAVKSYDLRKVLLEIDGIMALDTYIIPLMNGFDIYNRIRQIVKIGLAFPSCVIFGGRRLDFGKSALYLPGPVFFGPDPIAKEIFPSAVLSFLKVFDGTPINFKWVPDPNPIIWQKYLGNVALNLVGAYSSKILGEILANPDHKQLLIDILNEAAEVIAKKTPLPPNVVESVLAVIQKMPYETKSSFAVDVESHSPRNEGDIFGTAMIDLGIQVGVPTPTIKSIFAEIEKKTVMN
jgi:2-dehydropantoate 2-reductase